MISCLRKSEKINFTDLAGFKPGPVRFEIIKALDPNDAADLTRAIQAHQFAMRPATRTELAKALQIMAARVISRDKGEQSSRLIIEAYLASLAEFPGDIALAVLHEWPAANKFFPAWAELQARIDALCALRKARYAALVKLSHTEPRHIEERPKRADPTHVAAKMKSLRAILAGKG